jgi:hypothetical protein
LHSAQGSSILISERPSLISYSFLQNARGASPVFLPIDCRRQIIHGAECIRMPISKEPPADAEEFREDCLAARVLAQVQIEDRERLHRVQRIRVLPS